MARIGQPLAPGGTSGGTRRHGDGICRMLFYRDLITRDQVESYARRKGMPVAEVDRRLSPNMAYEAK
jgi:hypothetical protein